MHPVLEQVRATVPSENHPFGLIVRGRVAVGGEEEFQILANEVTRGTVAEAGNEFYRFFLSPDDRRGWVLLESWRDFPALVAHFESPHLKDFFDAYSTVADGELAVEVLPAP